MRAFVTPGLVRYVAEFRAAPSDSLCDDRPSPEHVWVDGFGWQLPANLQDIEAGAVIDSFNLFDRLWFEVSFNHENRIRQLEGQPQISKVAFRDFLKQRVVALRS
jgi:hypothetical protein